MKYVSATHDMTSLTAEFVSEDGTRYLRTGGTICWRFFNPGNIRPSKTSVCNPMKIGVGKTKSGSFMIFPDYETGWLALKKLLRLTYKDFTVDQIASVYAPGDDGNDTLKYTTCIIEEAGVDARSYVRDMDDATLEKLMEAIKKIEGYYNKKSTQQENIIPTTNITITDGSKPIENEKVKVIIDQCTYEWETNHYGKVPAIAHLSGRSKIAIAMTGPDGADNIVYTTPVGSVSQNIILMKKFDTITAKTGVHRKDTESHSFYSVKKGDTLSKIAIELHTTVKRLATLNGIVNENIISVGQKLKIPDGVSKPQSLPSSQKGQSEVYTGISDNGYPQANVNISKAQVPWMTIALEQARLWAGKNEYQINVNYHSEVEVNLDSIRGDTNPWCASFVNYCLISSKPAYSKSNSPAKALSFSEDKKNFRKLEKPLYGAIAVFKRSGGVGHACFVCGASKNKKGNIIVLGGNQNDSINFVDRSENKLVGYYFPITYYNIDDSIALDELDVNLLNESLHIKTNGVGREA